MKVVLKNGETYNIKRTANNIITPEKFTAFMDNIPDNTECIYVSDLILDINADEICDLFKIEQDFSTDNISEVTYITESGTAMQESYNAVGKILQNISDYVNETVVVLLKFK